MSRHARPIEATLPDAEALAERLAAAEPHPVPISRRALPLGAIGLALAAALFGPPLIGTLAPWLALGGVAVAAVRRAKRSKRLSAELEAAEATLRLRRPEHAFHRADRLLDDFVHEPAESARCVHLMTGALQALRRPEAARVACGVLLDRLPPHHPARAGVLVHRAIAEFESDRLADGDATLGRLRGLIDLQPGNAAPAPAAAVPNETGDRRVGQPLPPPDRGDAEVGAAAFRFARLVQSASTFHAADAVSDADAAGGAAAAFRPLGVDAGFAHGLLAWCHHELRDAAAASAAWATATTLVPAAALIQRFPRLASVAAAHTETGALPA